MGGDDDLNRPLLDRFGADAEASFVWHCPVCSAEILHEYRAGRKRVYCSQACRQRAYRWRCAHGIRIRATPWQPAQRSGLVPRSHAVRPPSDYVGRPTDGRNRHVAVCGAFATVVAPEHVTHNEFVPGSRSACRSCTALIGADPDWHRDYPVLVEAPVPYYVRYRPPEERRADYLARRSASAHAGSAPRDP